MSSNHHICGITGSIITFARVAGIVSIRQITSKRKDLLPSPASRTLPAARPTSLPAPLQPILACSHQPLLPLAVSPLTALNALYSLHHPPGPFFQGPSPLKSLAAPTAPAMHVAHWYTTSNLIEYYYHAIVYRRKLTRMAAASWTLRSSATSWGRTWGTWWGTPSRAGGGGQGYGRKDWGVSVGPGGKIRTEGRSQPLCWLVGSLIGGWAAGAVGAVRYMWRVRCQLHLAGSLVLHHLRCCATAQIDCARGL